MTRFSLALLIPFVSVHATGSTSAATITFEEKLIDHLHLAGVQTEGDYSYAATSGDSWELITDLGNPPSSLATFYNGEDPDVGYTFEIWNTSGELFTFESVDYLTTSNFNYDQVTITGFLSGAPIGSLGLEDPAAAWQTVAAGFSGAIDRLQVEVRVDSASAMLLDNFVITTVPEPASGLMLAGLATIVILGTRRAGRR